MRGGSGGVIVLTQGGGAPGRTGVPAALTAGFSAAALTQTGPRDPAADCRVRAEEDRRTQRGQEDRGQQDMR